MITEQLIFSYVYNFFTIFYITIAEDGILISLLTAKIAK